MLMKLFFCLNVCLNSINWQEVQRHHWFAMLQNKDNHQNELTSYQVHSIQWQPMLVVEHWTLMLEV